jgi:hypothetical protein
MMAFPTVRVLVACDDGGDQPPWRATLAASARKIRVVRLCRPARLAVQFRGFRHYPVIRDVLFTPRVSLTTPFLPADYQFTFVMCNSGRSVPVK